MTLEDLYRLLRSGHVQAQGIVDTLDVPLLVLDEALRVVTPNNAFLRTFKITRDDVLEKSVFSLGNGQWDIPELKLLFSAIIPKSAGVLGYEITHDFPAIGKRTFIIDAQRLVHPDNNSVNILVQLDDVSERKRLDAERDFVIAETRHRMKNIFSIVRAIAYQTKTENTTAEQYREALLGRIDAATRAQELSLDLEKSSFADVIGKATGGVGADQFFITAGPSATLRRSRVLPVSMIFHELTTNALKYGALSAPEGQVHIDWTIDSKDGQEFLVCGWRERGGPPCREPERRGYGISLLQGTANHMGGAVDLAFDPSGLVALIRIPL